MEEGGDKNVVTKCYQAFPSFDLVLNLFEILGYLCENIKTYSR